MHNFHPLKITKYNKETNDCINIGLEIPDSLKYEYQFKQGQYINVRFLLNGEDLRRSYSIVNAPSDNGNEIEVLVKHIQDGKISSYLNHNLKLGDSIETLAPQGHFYTSYHPSNEKTYIGLAAGSGISPVISNLIEALIQEPKSKAYLFFSNKTQKETIFYDRLETLSKRFNGRLKITYLVSREKHAENPLFEGRISPEKLKEIFQHFPEIKIQEATYFICGPIDMIKKVSRFLKEEEKTPSLQVLYEYYQSPDDEENSERSEEFKKIPNIESFITVIIDDDEYDFHLNSKKESILDKAIIEKLPVPFSCKGGVCCTCKAQVLEGEVFMEKNYALTEEEIEKGYVLTCQSHPVTNVVLLNYDV